MGKQRTEGDNAVVFLPEIDRSEKSGKRVKKMLIKSKAPENSLKTITAEERASSGGENKT